MKRRNWLLNKGYYKELYDETRFTKSTYFIMPMIGYVWNDFISYAQDRIYLINCYISEDRSNIVLVFDYLHNDESQLAFLSKNEINSYFINATIDVNNEELILTYKVPPQYKEDLDIFMTSKYSKMSMKYKQVLLSIYGRETEKESYKPKPFDVLFPTSYKKKQLADYIGVDIEVINQVGEVSSRLDMEYEIYKEADKLQLNETIENRQIEEDTQI